MKTAATLCTILSHGILGKAKVVKLATKSFTLSDFPHVTKGKRKMEVCWMPYSSPQSFPSLVRKGYEEMAWAA